MVNFGMALTLASFTAMIILSTLSTWHTCQFVIDNCRDAKDLILPKEKRNPFNQLFNLT